jgi:predicted RNA-binding Zn-ribbon protein involved in translation (DUF1610 family)
MITNRKQGGAKMARRRTVTYECEQCGSEIVVTSTGEGELSPIYCCGNEVTETSLTGKKAVRPKKKVVKSISGKKGTPKKQITAKKKISKK